MKDYPTHSKSPADPVLDHESMRRRKGVLFASILVLLLGFSVGAYGQASKIVFHSDEYPVICEKANKIVFSSDRDTPGTFDIWIMNTDGSGKMNLTPNTPISNEHEPHCGVTTSTGNMIVFRSDMDGDDEIYRVNTDGTGIKQLTFNDKHDTNPQWCGDRIIFVRDLLDGDACCTEDPCSDPTRPTNSGKDPQLYMMNKHGDLFGSPARELTCANNPDPGPNCTASGPDVMFFFRPTCHVDANGTTVAMSAYQPADYAAREIFRMPLCPDEQCCVTSHNDPDLTQLTNTTRLVEDDYPSWSPGGNFITFASNRLDGLFTTDWEIYKMDSEFGELFDPPTPLTFDPADDVDPQWGEVKE